MVRYAITRVLVAIPLLLLVATANFVLMHLAPGDPVTVLVGEYPVPEGYIDEVRARYGLDRSLPEQLFLYLGQLLQGNFGTSFAWQQPVFELVVDRLGATLRLTGTAFVIATVGGLLLGILASRRPNSAVDTTVRVGSLVAFSIPGFWLAQLLLILFAVQLRWLPVSGDGPIRGTDDLWVSASYLVLPVAALVAREIAVITRVSRTALLEVHGQDYLTAARARGRRPWSILWAHEVRNAAPPIVTLIGMNLGYLIAGSVLIETVFAWPGIGRLLYDSIGKRDYPVMSAILLMVAAAVILANLLTDIVVAALDPRVRR